MPISYNTYYRINNRGHRLRGSGTSNPYFFAIERPDLHDTLNVNAAFAQPSQLTMLSVIGLTDDDRVVVIPWSYTGEATTGWLWSPTRAKRILVSNLSVQAMTPIDLNEAGQILARLHLADSTYVLAVLTPSS